MKRVAVMLTKKWIFTAIVTGSFFLQVIYYQGLGIIGKAKF